ncbi:helix-turn-helix domain-containing protein [Facklamia sp. P12945]|uniref:helix-turn-helix domain-containing protein n=1 Tax=Facklamia sp. P12945 TaxID=3421950 RepID=UPI003D1719CC
MYIKSDIRRDKIGVSYRPLWIELAKREMGKVEFQEYVGISGNLLAKLGKNDYISMRNLEQICRKMKLSPNEVIEFKEEEKNDN